MFSKAVNRKHRDAAGRKLYLDTPEAAGTSALAQINHLLKIQPVVTA